MTDHYRGFVFMPGFTLTVFMYHITVSPDNAQRMNIKYTYKSTDFIDNFNKNVAGLWVAV